MILDVHLVNRENRLRMIWLYDTLTYCYSLSFKIINRVNESVMHFIYYNLSIQQYRRLKRKIMICNSQFEFKPKSYSFLRMFKMQFLVLFIIKYTCTLYIAIFKQKLLLSWSTFKKLIISRCSIPLRKFYVFLNIVNQFPPCHYPMT